MGKHYTVLVQIKEITDAGSVTVHGVKPQTTEAPRVVHDKLNLAATEDTFSDAVDTALSVLRLMHGGAVIDGD